jgi:hypothetical protein
VVLGVGTPVGGPTNLYTYTTANYGTAVPATTLQRTYPLGAIIDYDGAGAAGIITSSIALPSNYAFGSPGFERAWASTASVGAAFDNVWRCDGALAAVALGRNVAIKSIAYSGDVNTGTLFEGDYATAAISTQVFYTTQPQSNLPVWTNSYKPPTGNGGRAFVRTSPNFGADKTVFCGTYGPNESAFSVSVDAGVTYDQIGLVNNNVAGGLVNTVGTIDGLMLSPDGATVFMATNDNAGAGVGVDQISVWKSPTPPTLTSWTRISCITKGVNASTGLITVNKSGWATAPEIYLFDTGIAANSVFASYDGGHIFSVPGYSMPLAGVVFASVESSKTLYAAIGGNVYKSTNGGLVWSAAVPANVGAVINSVVACGGGHVLAAGNAGAISRSTDGGATFTQLTSAGINTAWNYIAVPSDAYATNKTIFAGAITGARASSVYRINADTGTLWENVINPTVPTAGIRAMGFSNGAFYAMDNQSPGGILSCDRTLNPLATVGTITWGTMNVPAGGALAPTALGWDVAANKVYQAIGAAPALYAYNDILATVKPTITSPADGYTLSVNPLTGVANPLLVSWTATGTSNGLANSYTFAIYEATGGVPALVIFAGRTTGGPWPVAPQLTIYPTTLPIAPANPDFIYGFVPGVKYGMIIRADNEFTNDAIVSQWSAPVTITVAAFTSTTGPALQAPALGGSNVPLRPGFAWGAITDVVKWEYELSASAATKADGTFTTPVASAIGASALTSNSYQLSADLTYNTTYFWHVRGINAASLATPWSTGSFSTMAAPVAPTPPVVVTQQTVSPAWIWAVVIIGAILVITVVVLIFVTRRP